MKKIIVLLTAMMISPMVTAAPTTLPTTNFDYRITDCSLLANDIRIILTSNVVGTADCNAANNRVALSLCHTSGQSNDRSAVVTDTDGDGINDCDPATDAAQCVQTVTGSVFPSASTGNGTVVQSFPGQTCSAANAAAIASTMASSTN